MVVPDLCNDAHDCPLATADGWLKSWLPQILAGPDFRAGRLAVVVTADEDDSKSGNLVLTAVLHPSLDRTHKVVTTRLTHYSLTRFYDDVLRVPRLRNAATAPSMSAAFGL
jgi:acid phosphatase